MHSPPHKDVFTASKCNKSAFPVRRICLKSLIKVFHVLHLSFHMIKLYPLCFKKWLTKILSLFKTVWYSWKTLRVKSQLISSVGSWTVHSSKPGMVGSIEKSNVPELSKAWTFGDVRLRWLCCPICWPLSAQTISEEQSIENVFENFKNDTTTFKKCVYENYISAS